MNVPDYVKKELPASVVAKLTEHGHAITFPHTSACQMRFQHMYKIHAYYYTYSEYGSILRAVTAAMSRYEQLRTTHNVSHLRTRYRTTGGVRFCEVACSRTGVIEYRCVAHYKNNKGKSSNKTFYMGRTGAPSADQQLHAFRTAKLFRHYYETHGPGLDVAMFKGWKYKRLYAKGKPYFDWDNA